MLVQAQFLFNHEMKKWSKVYFLTFRINKRVLFTFISFES
ncbi:hypothetical protein NT03LS_2073 [Listeria seeligeri FSL N1-067]|uniref:Uncharacterized protein n=1 Tax=Listeria seeligeri FSL N1-067 TaxID=702453 RepID=E3ZRF1_LISSE|nr:hypothetical protein NT03LS_2073 [Listeria seeligeri FSL N1-067]